MVFQSFDFEQTWRILFKPRTVLTKLDINISTNNLVWNRVVSVHFIESLVLLTCLYCKKKKKRKKTKQIKFKWKKTSWKVHLARWLGLNPRRTGVNTSIFSIQWFNWPATYGADSPHVTPINKTLLLPSDAYKYNRIWNLYVEEKKTLFRRCFGKCKGICKRGAFLMLHNC